MRFLLFFLLLLAPQTGGAETLTCPVGGERFESVSLNNCVAEPRLTMVLAPARSCDSATVLQQCPQNFLPLYKAFSEADLALLKEYMLSESYDSVVDRSRYYLAYQIEKYLGEGDSGIPFLLLYEGLWRDPLNTFTDEIYLEDFLYEIPAEIRRVAPEAKPYLQSIAAFVMLKAGRRAAAVEMLKSAVENLRAALPVDGRPLELVAEQVRLSVRDLQRLIGKVEVEELLDHIFSEFCIGK
jgi:hypothetical protein